MPKKNKTLQVQLNDNEPTAMVIDVMGKVNGCCHVDLGTHIKVVPEDGVLQKNDKMEMDNGSRQEEEDGRVNVGEEIEEANGEEKYDEVSFVADSNVIGRDENVAVLCKINKWVDRCVQDANEEVSVVQPGYVEKVHKKRQKQLLKAEDYMGVDAEKVELDRGLYSEGASGKETKSISKEELRQASISLTRKIAK